MESALGSTSVQGQDPAAVPLYSMAYALYYNKKMFADAGIEKPPATWDELAETGKKLSKNGKWGARRGGFQPLQQHPPGVRPRQAARRGLLHPLKARPTSPRTAAVAAVKQYVDLMARTRSSRPATPSTRRTSP